jgi:MFS superfamily sulfate permease-like transporter
LPSLPSLPPLFTRLPGAAQRRRAVAVTLVAVLALLLRPLGPLQFLPGWCVGALLLWATFELLRWLWWPTRWR